MNHFVVKSEIMKAVLNGASVVIIDPENEYVDFAKMLGGKVETIDSSDSNGGLYEDYKRRI